MKQAIWLLAVVVVVALALFIYTQRQSPDEALPRIELPPEPPPLSDEPRHPVPAPPPVKTESAAPPLPPLDASDSEVQEAVVGLFGRIGAFLIPDDIVRRIVVTVDNLPRKKVAVELRSVKPTPGLFVASGDEDSFSTNAENYRRYDPFVELVQSADAAQLASIYFGLYPLFQQAYEELGYPTGHFNDRLVETIDHLIATREPEAPVALVRPKVFYEYADPSLEARSAGQKLLMRMGNEHAAVIKAKLAELRLELVRESSLASD